MSQQSITGSCLCGKVRYAVHGHFGIFQYCHCSRCRKFTGSAFSPGLLAPPERFEWLSGEHNVGRFEVPDARHYATSFCKTCGSSLPWLAQTGKSMVIPAGTLDEAPDIKPFQNIFMGSKAPWYVAPGSLPEYDELPQKD